jgi:hypothetical protein
MGREEGEGERC